MHHHPETLLVLHKERQSRLEVEAARHRLLKSLRRRRRRARTSAAKGTVTGMTIRA